MDTYSGAAVAQLLGTTVPRVQRAIARLGMSDRRGRGGRLRLTAADVARLEEALGRTPSAPGLSRTDAAVLAALSHAPLGVLSARAIATRARLSPTATSRSLQRLLESKLVIHDRKTLALGKAREVWLWRANVLSPQWSILAPTLARVAPPHVENKAAPARRVPRTLRHLFWNTADSQLDIARNGGYVARRLLASEDLEGLAWGAENLSSADWRHAAKMRGIPPDRRALAQNLAAAAHR